MSSSSDDDVPLGQRPGFLLSAKNRQQIVLDEDSDSPVPSWLAEHKSPAKPGQPIALSDSDSDVKEVLSQPTEPAAAAGPSSAVAPGQQQQQQQQQQQGKKAATPGKAKGKAAAQPTASQPGASSTAPKKLLAGLVQAPSHTLPVTLPDRLSQLKVLVEMESTDELHGATDLSGDSGAIGRVAVASGGAGGAQQLQIDLKGVLYSATIVPCPVTMAVVNIGATEAKVECMFTEFVQLREDTRFATGADGALLDGLLDDGDDNYVFGDANDGEGGGITKAGSRKRAAEAKAPAKARRAGAGGAAAKKPRGGAKNPAKRAKPKGGGAKKAAPVKKGGVKKK